MNLDEHQAFQSKSSEWPSDNLPITLPFPHGDVAELLKQALEKFLSEISQ